MSDVDNSVPVAAIVSLVQIVCATLAQLVEHRFRKAGVPSSNLGGGSRTK